MIYKIRLAFTDDRPCEHLRQVVNQLDMKCFGDLEWKTGLWWLVWDEEDKPIGYAGMRVIEGENTAYFCRVGVLPKHRGNGLQKKLIEVRSRYAKRLGCEVVVTYTSADNSPSINSLVSRGFRHYNPEYPWAGSAYLYWRKTL